MRTMKKRKEKNSRFLWADVIRVTAIFLVVFVHNFFFLPPNTIGTLWMWVPYLYAYIGIPLFVMISGALLLSKNESLSFFFQKRVRSVLLPWIFWIAVYIAIDYVVHQNRPITLDAWIRYVYQMFFSRFWFLPMIFGLYLLAPLLGVLVRGASKKMLVYGLSLWYFAFALLPAIYKAFGIYLSLDSSLLRQVMQYSGLFIIGFLLTRKPSFKKTPRFWLMLLLASLGATYVSVFLTSFTLNEQQTDPFFYKIFSPTMIPGVIAVFMLLFTLSQRWEKKVSMRSRSILAAMSEAALGIYLAHEIVQQVIAERFPFIDSSLFLISPLLAVPVRAVIVFLISFVFIFLLRRIALFKLFT